MKKPIVIAAVAAVLGAGAYVEPAKANSLQALQQRYVSIVRSIGKPGELVAGNATICAKFQEQLGILKQIEAKGATYGDQDNHNGQIRIMKSNISNCKDLGYLGGRRAPVAQRQPSYSDPIDNYFAEAARQTGIPVSLLMGPGAAVPGQSNEQRKRSCENAGSRWIERGPSGWPVCDHSRGASHSRDLPGLPVNR